jgi:hypothetical protein
MQSEPKLTIPVVINTTYGMFGLSLQACNMIAERKACTYDSETAYFIGNGLDLYVQDLPRHDPDLVAVVKELGANASASGSRLVVKHVIVSIPIDNYDGKESISGECVYVAD